MVAAFKNAPAPCLNETGQGPKPDGRLASQNSNKLAEVSEQMALGTKAGRMAAVSRLHQIAAVASTLAFSIKARA